MSRSDKNWKNKALKEAGHTEAFFDATRVPVADLVIGSEVVTGWKSVWIGTPEMGFETMVPSTTLKVTDRIPCPGNNGMHVHINKTNCYDSRALVYVKRT